MGRFQSGTLNREVRTVCAPSCRAVSRAPDCIQIVDGTIKVIILAAKRAPLDASRQAIVLVTRTSHCTDVLQPSSARFARAESLLGVQVMNLNLTPNKMRIPKRRRAQIVNFFPHRNFP